MDSLEGLESKAPGRGGEDHASTESWRVLDDLDHRRKYLFDRSGSGHGVSQGHVHCEHGRRGHNFQVTPDVRHNGRKLDDA